jgi:hypothetical protein
LLEFDLGETMKSYWLCWWRLDEAFCPGGKSGGQNRNPPLDLHGQQFHAKVALSPFATSSSLSLHPLIVELFDFLLEIFSSLESWLREALYFLSSSCSFLFSPYNFLFSSGNFLNSRRCCSSWNLSRRCSTLGCTIFSFLEGSLLFGSAHFSSWQYFTRSSSVASLCRVLSFSVEDFALPWLDRSAKFCAFALVAS